MIHLEKVDWGTVVVALTLYGGGVTLAVDTIRNWLGHHAPGLCTWVGNLGYGWQVVAVGIGVGAAFLTNLNIPQSISDNVQPEWVAKVVTGVALAFVAGWHHNHMAMKSAIKNAKNATH